MSQSSSDIGPFARFRQLILPEKRDVIYIVLFSLAVSVLSLATPITVESLVNTVAFGVLLWPIIVIALILLSCLGLAAIIKAMKVYVVEYLQRKLFVRVVADYSQRIPVIKYESFDNHYGPEITNRFFDILTFQKSVATLLLDGVAILVTIIVGMTVLAFYHPFLLGFDVVLLVSILFILIVLGWRGVRTGLDESHAKYHVVSWLEEVSQNPKLFKSANGLEYAKAQAEYLTDEYLTTRNTHFRVIWRQILFSLLLQVIASTALLGLGGWLVVNRQLTLGQLVASELIVTLIVASVAKLGKYSETYYDMLASAEKLGVLTDFETEKENTEKVKPTNLAMKVFYQTDKTQFEINPSERVAIMGFEQHEQSSLMETVACLRSVPEYCQLHFDGIDSRSLSLLELRDQIMLLDRPEAITNTIIENVRLGKDITLGEVQEALSHAGLESVFELSEGIDTRLSPDGRPLSFQETILLNLARAYAHKPKLLIVSECVCLMLQKNLRKILDKNNNWTLVIFTNNSEVRRWLI
jgi:putative ABC transport system ATP-binding protein